MEDKRIELLKQDNHAILMWVVIILISAAVYAAGRFLFDYIRSMNKMPPYRVNCTKIKGIFKWYVEEKHFFYFVPLHGVYDTEYEAEQKREKLNEYLKNKDYEEVL